MRMWTRGRVAALVALGAISGCQRVAKRSEPRVVASRVDAAAPDAGAALPPLRGTLVFARNGELVMVPVAGGATRTLGQLTSDVPCAFFSADGTLYTALTMGGRRGIAVVRPGQEPRLLGPGDRPQLSPDGAHLAYWCFNERNEVGQCVARPDLSGQVVLSQSATASFAWAGDKLVYILNHGYLRRFDPRAGGDPVPVRDLDENDDYAGAAIAPSGQQLALATAPLGLRLLDLGPGTSRVVTLAGHEGHLSKCVFAGEAAVVCSLPPDRPGETGEIVRIDPVSGRTTTVTGDVYQGDFAVSPDHRWIAFAPRHSDVLEVVPWDGGKPIGVPQTIAGSGLADRIVGWGP
jgi:hypothetical protein